MTDKNRRVMTSSIYNMSVAEVRKFLNECRKKHMLQTFNSPMFITDLLSNGMTIQDFALKFQQGHHQKRHNKGSQTKQSQSNPQETIESKESVSCNSSSGSDYDDYENIYFNEKSNEPGGKKRKMTFEQLHQESINNVVTKEASVYKKSDKNEITAIMQTMLSMQKNTVSLFPTIYNDELYNQILYSDSNTAAQTVYSKKRGRPKKDTNLDRQMSKNNSSSLEQRNLMHYVDIKK
jgi:hypothetical protein